MSNPQAPQRAVLAIGGHDRVKFLQDLVTNEVTADMGLTYAALLSPQGKYLFDFFLIAKDHRILLDIRADCAAALTQRLTMYRLRADVTIKTTDIPVATGTGPAPTDTHTDPRHKSLGWRGYGVGTSDNTDREALRVTHQIPETGIELIANESYILEMGFERLHGVDFKKGCYVGQEVTARMKHKTELRKGLTRLKLTAPVPPNTPILRDGKPIGTVHTVAGDHALAYLQFERAGEGMTAGGVAVLQV
jgi:tRNA-modifying protein YgfZ